MKLRQYPAEPILLVDDEEPILRNTAAWLASAGINNVETCADSAAVYTLLKHHPHSALVLDLAMPPPDGETLLPKIREELPELPVIVVTGAGSIDSAVRCLKSGAADYLAKPVEPARLAAVLRRILELGEARRECADFKTSVFSGRLRAPELFSEIITRAPSMRTLFQYVETIAPTAHTALITGETGTGKELLAEAIHRASGRTGTFLAINIAGIDDSMFSDTLFGHTKGAYTGASESRKGILAQAEGGTVLLDEIGDLHPASQVKLLRLLESSEYFPLGSDLPRRSSARFIVSTHQHLAELVRAGRFRRDLYYRINSHEVRLPPLRERHGDMDALLRHFIAQAAQEMGIPTPAFPPQLPVLLGTYPFPGNIRELRSLVYAVMSRHTKAMLPMTAFAEVLGIDSGLGTPEDFAPPLSFGPVLPTLRYATETLIAEALRRAEGNPGIAAGLLGISRQALAKRLSRQEGPGKPRTPAKPR